MLTGNYPKTTFARFNSTNYSQLNVHPNMVDILKANGYTTLYGADETRFCVIDQRFGFNNIIHPKIGLSNFLLGDVNDFIHSNYIVNSFIGRWLFPYSHLNRAAVVTYYPTAYTRTLSERLKKIKQRPLFLAMHLELTHWPYTYAGYKKKFDRYSLNFKKLYPHYKAMVNEADTQFGEILNVLSKRKLLC